MSSVATGRCKKSFFVGNVVQESLRLANFIHEHEHMYLKPKGFQKGKQGVSIWGIVKGNPCLQILHILTYWNHAHTRPTTMIPLCKTIQNSTLTERIAQHFYKLSSWWWANISVKINMQNSSVLHNNSKSAWQADTKLTHCSVETCPLDCCCCVALSLLSDSPSLWDWLPLELLFNSPNLTASLGGGFDRGLVRQWCENAAGGPGAYELVAVERMAEDHGIFAFGRCSSECGKSIVRSLTTTEREPTAATWCENSARNPTHAQFRIQLNELCTLNSELPMAAGTKKYFGGIQG